MTLIQRLRQFFFRNAASSPLVTPSTGSVGIKAQKPIIQVENEPAMADRLYSQPAPLPDWLLDEDVLRDEGVLFGLSDASPDRKTAQIRAAFAQQSAPLEREIEHCTKRISAFNRIIEQHENQLVNLRDQVTNAQNSQPTPHTIIRTVVGLGLSVVMGIGNFYLVDEALRPAFPNRWIAVGIFLSGMFNLFGRTSFFYETDSRLSGSRIIEEIGLPLAASLFVFIQSLQTQSTGPATGLFVFIFFAFLLSGKLLLSTLTALQHDLAAIRQNQRSLADQARDLPIWQSELDRIERAVDTIQAQKQPVVTVLTHTETDLAQLMAQRDQLINLFLSEFELARSLRERLTEQQRDAIFN